MWLTLVLLKHKTGACVHWRQYTEKQDTYYIQIKWFYNVWQEFDSDSLKRVEAPAGGAKEHTQFLSNRL